MKWKKITTESIDDVDNEIDGPQTPFKVKGVDEITPDNDGWGSYASDARFLIDEYLGKQAKAYYTNGHIPEDEEEEWRECLAAVLVEFEYWMPEDEDNYAGYEDGKMLFIIDKCDGELCEVDDFTNGCPEEIPDEARDEAKKEAYNFLGIKES